MDIAGVKRFYNICPDWNIENPCWVVPPNIFFVDGNYPEFELTYLFLNNYAKTQMKLFAILENLSKNFVSLIVRMFVWQDVEKDFDIKDFTEEKDIETLNMLHGEDF